jgi:hypothetical protein
MRVFKTKTFARWARSEKVPDLALCQAVNEMKQGLIDAKLGGGLVKKRVRRLGKGKRGGFRTIVGTNLGDQWFFLYGFAKNERIDIDDDELRLFQRIAQAFLTMKSTILESALQRGELVEIYCGEQTDT